MDRTHYTPNSPELQEHESFVTAEDRRILLGASIRLLGRRFHCGKSILKDDVVRLALLADDAAERVA